MILKKKNKELRKFFDECRIKFLSVRMNKNLLNNNIEFEYSLSILS